ncbi:hypothetical protein ARMSODRAFT_1019680 [Armillaria solidipes]|uniref:Uncharacterized protein n=1 Tax=Armillaria solidipes TaxID=1076256 RepID=A0A2H3BCF3_9AGAR|nr:hypothetical protein ARMSODRAFT_1019680 [Armillaria solidipes]
MPSPASSHDSSTLYTGSGPSSPGQHSSGYSTGSDMNIDSPPTALRAGIAPPGPSGGPSTPPRTAPSVQLQFDRRGRDSSPPPASQTDLLSALPIGRDHGASSAAPSPAPAPVLPPAPAAVLPPFAPVPVPDPAPPATSLMAEMIILGVIQGLAPYFDRLFALLLAIQQAAEAKATRK